MMRPLLASVACCLTAACTTLEGAPGIRSESFGWGPGVVIEEITRDSHRSLFHLVRTYDWSGHPDIAWGTGQSWFVLCAIGGLAEDRGARAVRFVYEIGDRNSLRPAGGAELFKDVPADKLYLRVDWLDAEGADPKDPLAKNIIPVNEQLRQFCSYVESTARRLDLLPNEAPARTPR